MKKSSYKTMNELSKKVNELEVLNQILLEKITQFSQNLYGNLCIFGKENLDYINDKMYSKLLKYPTLGIIELIKLIHYNEKYPENRNILMDELDDSKIHIFYGDRWQLIDFNDIFYTLIIKTFKLMDEYYMKEVYNSKDMNDIKEKVERLRYRINNKDKNFIKFSNEEIKIMIYRQQKKLK